MRKLIFNGIRIENKVRFGIFTALYALTVVLYVFLCSVKGIASLKTADVPGSILLIPIVSNIVYHGSLVSVVFIFLSFFEILFISWQTDLKKQRLNRFVLFCMAVNIILALAGMTVFEGIAVVIFALAVLLLITVLPAFTVLRIRQKKGTSCYMDYADILTSEEYEELKRRKKIK